MQRQPTRVLRQLAAEYSDRQKPKYLAPILPRLLPVRLVTKEQAVHNRERILAVAERLCRQKGVDAVGLAELMKEAVCDRSASS